MTTADTLLTVFAQRAAIIADAHFTDRYALTRVAGATKDSKGAPTTGTSAVSEDGRCRIWTGKVSSQQDRDGVTRTVSGASPTTAAWFPLTSIATEGDRVTINGDAVYVIAQVDPIGVDAAYLPVRLERAV